MTLFAIVLITTILNVYSAWENRKLARLLEKIFSKLAERENGAEN